MEKRYIVVAILMGLILFSGKQSVAAQSKQNENTYTKHSVEVVHVVPIPVPIVQFIASNTYILTAILFILKERYHIGLNASTLYKAILYGLVAFGVKAYCNYLLSDRSDLKIEHDNDRKIWSSVKDSITSMVSRVKESIGMGQEA